MILLTHISNNDNISNMNNTSNMSNINHKSNISNNLLLDNFKRYGKKEFFEWYR